MEGKPSSTNNNPSNPTSKTPVPRGGAEQENVNPWAFLWRRASEAAQRQIARNLVTACPDVKHASHVRRGCQDQRPIAFTCEEMDHCPPHG